MNAPYAPRDARVVPVALPDGGLYVPGPLTAELAAALQLLEAFVTGRAPVASARSPRMSRTAAAVMAASGEAAVQHLRCEARRVASAAPTVPAVTVLPAAQLAGSSEQMVTTAVAAESVGVTAEWVRRLAADGRIRSRRAPRNSWLVDLGDLRAYRAGRTRSSSDAADAELGREAGRGAA